MANSSTTPKTWLLNLESLSIKPPSYTSLKDVLPFSAAASHHVPIRNRLVKQAAWAYLQPMSPSPSGPSGPPFFQRLRTGFSSPSGNNPLATCLSFIRHHIVPSLTRAVHRILHAIPCFLCVIEE